MASFFIDDFFSTKEKEKKKTHSSDNIIPSSFASDSYDNDGGG